MVRYVPYYGKRLSRRWNTVLRAADKANIPFHLNSGHRTMREQWKLFKQNMYWNGYKWVPKPGHPLTAYPSPTAPHIRVGRANHAIDVSGAASLALWMRRKGARPFFPVPGEPWHMEIGARDLKRLARRLS